MGEWTNNKYSEFDIQHCTTAEIDILPSEIKKLVRREYLQWN